MTTPPLRVLVAPDKFKGTLTAAQAAAAIAAGVRRAVPDAQIHEMPIADGGEGTVDAVVAAGGRRYRAAVPGPLGDGVRADWTGTGDWAVIELAAASGLQHLSPTTRTARAAHTAGTGVLIRTALNNGFRRIAVGMGGSASTDGGAGALSALGARFLDGQGNPVPPGGAALTTIAEADLTGLDPRLTDSDVVLCCDVAVPLLGPEGAAAVFGPQKGADPATVAHLDAGLAQLAAALHAATGRDAARIGWGGAAGGTAGGLYAALGARYQSGFDRVAGLLDLDAWLDRVDLVVVGEGRMDRQSVAGKAPVALARRANARSLPVLAVVGALDVPATDLAANGIELAASALAEAGSIATAIRDPEPWVRRAAETAIRQHQRIGDHSGRWPGPAFPLA